jgi:hypothetical protein
MASRLDPALFPFGLPDTSTDDERRSEPRVSCRKPIEIIPGAGLHDWNPIRAEMVDCGGHGVGIIVDRAMQAGEQFVVKLQLDRARLLIYTVRHARQTPEGRFQIGAEFTGFFAIPCQVDPHAILAALLALER